MSCIDIAAKQKLFSIIVDKFETAKEVLDVNKEIKGGVVNIFPLETLDSLYQDRKKTPSNCKPMLDIVSLTANAGGRLQSLVDSIFGKVVLVK